MQDVIPTKWTELHISDKSLKIIEDSVWLFAT